jgi:hypothetical protein
MLSTSWPRISKKRSQTLSNLRKPDGSLSTDITETVTYLLDDLISKYEKDNDSEYHNTIRSLSERPIQTADDREYTPEEIRTTIDDINSKKAQ